MDYDAEVIRGILEEMLKDYNIDMNKFTYISGKMIYKTEGKYPYYVSIKFDENITVSFGNSSFNFVYSTFVFSLTDPDGNGLDDCAMVIGDIICGMERN